MKNWIVVHEIVRYGEVTQHTVGSYPSRWRAMFWAWWHAAFYLGPYDAISIREERP